MECCAGIDAHESDLDVDSCSRRRCCRVDNITVDNVDGGRLGVFELFARFGPASFGPPRIGFCAGHQGIYEVRASRARFRANIRITIALGLGGFSRHERAETAAQHALLRGVPPPPRHRAEPAWTKFRMGSRHMLTKAVSVRYTLKHSWTETFVVLTWVCVCVYWLVHTERLSIAEGTILRMVRLCIHLSRPGEEDWLSWHRWTWHQARQQYSVVLEAQSW